MRAAVAVLAPLLFVLGAFLIIVQPDVDEPGEEWYLRALAAIPLATVVVLLEVLLFDISLRTSTDRLVKRGVWRVAVNLRTARFRLVETTWRQSILVGTQERRSWCGWAR